MNIPFAYALYVDLLMFAGSKGEKGEPGEKGKRGLIGFIGYKGEQGNVLSRRKSDCLVNQALFILFRYAN